MRQSGFGFRRIGGKGYTVGQTEVEHYFREKFANVLRGKPLPASVEKLSAKRKAMLFSRVVARRDWQKFDPNYVRETIIPFVVKQPQKAALGLGSKAHWFFAGLGSEIELLFSELCKEGKLEKFVRRLYYKDQLAAGDAYHLGRGIAPKAYVFGKALGQRGYNHFNTALNRSNKTNDFLRGIREVIGAKS